MNRAVVMGLIVGIALALAGCAAAVREGRPSGANFSAEEYYRVGWTEDGARAPDPSPAELANALIGTDSAFRYSHGNLYPAVARPFGMNAWTPQTGANISGWLYTYRGRQIRGFRQTHQPSPWANDYACFSLMPVTGSPGTGERARASAFHHANEIAKPYYYRVTLDRYNVTAEITATERAALMRFTFPPDKAAGVILDTFGPGEAALSPAERKITGFTTYATGSVPANFKNWFVIVFDSDFEPGSEARSVRFPAGRTVTARMASSFIGPEQAELNLAREVGERGFGEVMAESKAAWDRELSRIAVSGGTLEERATFYSCLYRMLMFPRRFYELGPAGEVRHYSPYDGQVHDGYMYTDSGLWDTFRALFPFFTVMYPEEDSRIMQGFLNAYQEGGRLPSWSSPGYYNSMIGAHGASVLADAWVKGIRDFDPDLAWEAMVKDAEVPETGPHSLGRYGLEYYNELGYVPSDAGVDQNVSRTLEYAYDDYCMARFAEATGRPDEAKKYYARAMNYKNLFDSGTNFMRPKKRGGEWAEPFDPFAWGGDYTEGSAWHYTWSVFHDPAGLIALMGGNGPFIEKLDSVFTTPGKAGWVSYGYKIHEITEMQAAGMGQYAHGNQPMQHAIYLYCWAGAPGKTQARAREVMGRLYNSYPNGYCGDEDNGQTSAWYALSALGFYPVCPGSGEYVLGSPLFGRADLKLDNGRVFSIIANGNSPANVYIRAARLNGQDLSRNFITHGEIIAGGELTLVMDANPNPARGTAPGDAPFSLSRPRSAP